VREELIQRNVAKLVQVRGATYEVNRGVNADQARKRVASENDRLKALYALALYLGLRRGSCSGFGGRTSTWSTSFWRFGATCSELMASYGR
jgi:hypothetical protein